MGPRMRAGSCLLLLCLSVPCFGQVKAPDTPAGQKFAAWLEVFNRGDREAYKEFLEKNYPSGVERAERAMAFREMTGGFDLKKVELSTPDTQVALVQERTSDQFARLTLEVEAAEPHRIVSIDLSAIPRPAEFPLPRLSESALIAAVREKLGQDAAAGRFAGTRRAVDSTRAPFVIGKGLDSAGTTFHFGLALEPDREYELQLGTPHGYGFRNVSDGVPLAPYRLRFRTRPTNASLKP
jgi:hypothetical protein